MNCNHVHVIKGQCVLLLDHDGEHENAKHEHWHTAPTSAADREKFLLKKIEELEKEIADLKWSIQAARIGGVTERIESAQ